MIAPTQTPQTIHLSLRAADAPPVSLLAGDCLERLRELPENSIDAIVTDPPAGIAFMGNDWDAFRRRHNPKDVGRENVFGRMSEHAPHSYGESDRELFIATMGAIFAEARRVLRPGGHALVWALPRTSHWTATAIEDAGFELRDRIHHVASGDAALVEFLASLDDAQRDAFLRLVDGQASTTLLHLFGSGYPKSHDISKALDKLAGAQRPVVGRYQPPSGLDWHLQQADDPDASFSASAFVTGDGGSRRTLDVTAPVTEEAQRWHGWGTALKPAVEHWIIARKPLVERTVVAQVQATGTGALNIDACRVNPGEHVAGGGAYGGVFGNGKSANKYGHDLGRWPAHLVLSHSLWCVEGEVCAPGCPVARLDAQSGERVSGQMKPGQKRRATVGGGGYAGGFGEQASQHGSYGDAGGASRFFNQFYYCSKASRSEREAGCEALEPRRLSDYAPGDPDETSLQTRLHGSRAWRNFHPTVKPIELMRWLTRMVTPPGGVVLDMFAGSCTTGVACIEEGFGFLGIEREARYLPIGEARLRRAFTRRYEHA